MKLNNSLAEIFVPDHSDAKAAIAKTTHMCISAHQDDIEIMAPAAVTSCYGSKDEWFMGVVVTDGAGSPRSGIYQDYSDEQMKTVRAAEQKAAAVVGGYCAQALLAYPSSQVKAPKDDKLVRELAELISLASPRVIYTHNLADKHDTHVAVTLRVIEAIRLLPADKRPEKLYSMEVWRGLDWVCDHQKAVFDTTAHQNLQAALLGVYDSQICGGKRYDLAAMGRRVANATFYASHDTDDYQAASYGLDITSLITEPTRCPEEFILSYIDSFRSEVVERLSKVK